MNLEKITLKIPLLAFCAFVFESSKNTAYRNLLELTDKLSGLNVWLKFDNSSNFYFQVLQNTEC